MKTTLALFKRRQILKYLKNSKPERLCRKNEKSIISAFHKLSSTSPAYRELLKPAKINPGEIQTLNDFLKQVPILNKKNFFSAYPLDTILGDNINKLKLTMTSSGFSKTFAYGFFSQKSLTNSRLGADITLDYWFNISKKKTFLINCSPMGVHIETSLPLAETSVRSDMVIALLKKVSPQYDQTILGGDPNFIKKVIEEGDEEKINWKQLNVSLVTGQDWLAENLRTYLSDRLEIDLDTPEGRGIYTTMGLTELGLNVFHESWYTVQIRRTMMKDPELRKRLTSVPGMSPPCIFHYYPFLTFIESVNNTGIPELLFTSLNRDSMLPMVRYASGDAGEVKSYTELKSILHDKYNSLLPDLKLPIGMVHGRIVNHETSVAGIRMEELKDAVFSDREIVPHITGLAKINQQSTIPEVYIHLKKSEQPSVALKKQIALRIQDYLNREIIVKVLPYESFPGALNLDYEKKLYV